MKRPVIGVIPLWDEKKDSIWMLPGYMQGLEEAGAIPVILPLTVSETVLKQTADLFDGFLFTGGHDVNPKLYEQEKTVPCGEICDQRDRMEAYIFHEAVLKQNKPALGICRGIQFFNAMLGGTLYQDIPTELPGAISHVKGPPYDVPAHSVRILPESPLYELFGKERIEVNSYHHQGINRIAEGLEIMAMADDGLVEAVYMPDSFYVWAVQWHPEFSLKDEFSKKIFASFVGKNIPCA
jgi:putative glutamine amidotransferase